MDDTNITVFGECIDGSVHMLSFQDILLTSLLLAAAIIGVILLLALCYDDNDDYYNNDILKPDKKDITNDNDDFKIKIF